MGEFVIRLVDALGLENPHAVGPDIGTSALLIAAAADPGRLRSVVIGSGGAAYPIQLGGIVKEVVEAPDLERYRSVDPREIIADLLSRNITRNALQDSVREDYLSSHERDRFVESMRYVRAYPAELPVLASLLPGIQTPVQIISGAHYPAIPPVKGEFLHERLPKSKHEVIDVGHFTGCRAGPSGLPLVPARWCSRRHLAGCPTGRVSLPRAAQSLTRYHAALGASALRRDASTGRWPAASLAANR